MFSKPFNFCASKKNYLQSLLTVVYQHQAYTYFLKGQAVLRTSQKTRFYLPLSQDKNCTQSEQKQQKKNEQLSQKKSANHAQIHQLKMAIQEKSLYLYCIDQFKKDQLLSIQQIKSRLILVGGKTRKYYMNQDGSITLQTDQNFKNFKYLSQLKLPCKIILQKKLIDFLIQFQISYQKQKGIYFPCIGLYDILYNQKTQQFCINPKSQILYCLGLIQQPSSPQQKIAFSQIPKQFTPSQSFKKNYIAQEMQFNPAFYLNLSQNKNQNQQKKHNKIIQKLYQNGQNGYITSSQFQNLKLESQGEIILKRCKSQQQQRRLYNFISLFNTIIAIYSVFNGQFFNIREFCNKKFKNQQIQIDDGISFKELKIQFVWRAFKCKKIMWLILQQTFKKYKKHQRLMKRIQKKLKDDLQFITFSWLKDQIYKYDQKNSLYENKNFLVDGLISQSNSTLLRFCESQKKRTTLILLSILKYSNKKSNKYDKQFYKQIIQNCHQLAKKKENQNNFKSESSNKLIETQCFQLTQKILKLIDNKSEIQKENLLKVFRLLIKTVKKNLVHIENLNSIQIHLGNKIYPINISRQVQINKSLLKFFAETFIVTRNIMSIFLQVIEEYLNVNIQRLRQNNWIFSISTFTFRQIQNASQPQLIHLFEQLLLSEGETSNQFFYQEITKFQKLEEQIQSFCRCSKNHLLNFQFLESVRTLLKKRINKNYTNYPKYDIWGKIYSYFQRSSFKQISKQNNKTNIYS